MKQTLQRVKEVRGFRMVKVHISGALVSETPEGDCSGLFKKHSPPSLLAFHIRSNTVFTLNLHIREGTGYCDGPGTM